jgi:hypothetical protein
MVVNLEVSWPVWSFVRVDSYNSAIAFSGTHFPSDNVCFCKYVCVCVCSFLHLVCTVYVHNYEILVSFLIIVVKKYNFAE